MEEKDKHNCIQDKNIAILNNNFEHMKWNIEEIKTLLTDFIKSSDYKFATKEQHKKNEEDIEKLKEDNINFKILIAKWLWIWYIISIIVWFLINKIF